MNLKKYLDAVNAAEARVQEIAAQINTHFEAGETEKALELRPELDKAKAEAKAASELYLSMLNATTGGEDPARRFVPAGGEREPQQTADLRASPEYTAAFIDAIRSGATPKSGPNGRMSAERYGLLINALTETGGSPTGEQGGFLLPIEFDNMIHERMLQFIDLADPRYFNVEDVQAYSGWRAVETGTAELPFSSLTELNVLADGAETESPEFTKVDYTVVDYGGFLRVSNSLLADTPVNIMRYISRWFGKKVVLTNNSLILGEVNKLSPEAVSDYTELLAALKTALNKTLDPAIAARSVIFTNQSGFDLMDQLDDGTGRPLLQPDPSNETRRRALGREVVVLSDAHWPNLSTPDRARIAIGDGTEFLTFFRRAPFEMASTNIGGSAWRSYSSEVRGILRADVATMDDEAMALLAVQLPE